ncbi:hypothetical protein ACFVXH_40155 [Kitasatospora sp. NPDC058184]|uniref:hypothetical protein n=1 Tax=unclassified Kitasatospora TaxID=2633591 RepID=UPI000670D006|nr:hypothetical protein [Kitasatospora sp. MY 5-36]
MTSPYLVDGQRVYAPAIGGRTAVLHLAVLIGRSSAPWAGCGRANRLAEDGLLFADEVGTARLCAATGCTGQPWNRGRGARPAPR